MVGRVAARDRAEFGLPNQAIAEIRPKIQAVGAEIFRELKLLPIRDLPRIGSYEQSCMRAVGLARIDCVLQDSHRNGCEAGDAALSVITGPEQRQQVMAEGVIALAIDFVLMAVLKEIEKTVAASDFHPEPRTRMRIARAPSGNKIVIARVLGNLNKGFQPRDQTVRHGKIDRVITVSHIKCSCI